VRITRTKSGVRLAVALFAVAGFLALAGSAMAAPTPPTGLISTPASPTNATGVTVTWNPSSTPVEDVGVAIVSYDWLVDGVLTGSVGEAGPYTTGLIPLAAGPHTIVVRANQSGPLAPADASSTDSAPLPILIDRTAPTISVTTTGPNAGGWFRQATRNWTCPADTGGSGLAAAPPCPADQTFTLSGSYPAVSATVQDNAGNVSLPATAPAILVDGINPPASTLSSPSNGTTVAAEPTFAWTESEDKDQNNQNTFASGTDRYELWADWGNGDTKIATLVGPKHITAPPSEYDTLPQLKDIEWFVKAIDTAGNVSGESGHRKFRIDPSVPPGPTITNGPGGQTNDTTPAFAWSGTQPTFEWSVIPAGANSPVQQGSGASKQVTLGALAPGDYTFRVIQVSAAGVESEETTYPFTLDTSAPAPPVIDARPINGSKDITPSFSWRGETHATYTWKVIGAGGGVVRGDSTTDTSLTLAPLTPGPYTFQITQTDRAGNTSSAAVDPFSIIGPSGLLTGTKLSLPTTNHRRLKPRRGITVATRRPVLRWTPGPRGTTLYNVQLFRVTKRTTGKARVTKVFTTFPRALQYRVPAARTRPATCYVWRVWPYLGTRFTKRPLGISNFCIANKATLLKAAQRKAARAQAARAGTAAR
jgi:hypothetical protein